MKQLETLPVTSVELIEELDARFPAKCIAPDDTLITAHRYAAKRQFIEWLMELRDKRT